MKLRCGEKQRIKCKRKQKKLLKRNKKQESLPLFVSVGSVRYSTALCFVSVEKNSSETVYHALVAG